MSKINDGGPAFPLSAEMAFNPVTTIGGDDVSSGMSLRDYFAAQALAGELAAEDIGECAVLLRSKESAELMAARAYHMADAMLLARSRPEEGNG